MWTIINVVLNVSSKSRDIDGNAHTGVTINDVLANFVGIEYLCMGHEFGRDYSAIQDAVCSKVGDKIGH